MTDFTLRTITSTSFDDTVANVRSLLQDAGFGVLTEIDLAATLKNKLGEEIPRQLILGACRPQLAHQAVQADPRIAAMLPCNVVVADESADGETKTRVEIFDPIVMTSFAASDSLAEVATDARDRLAGVLENLES